MPAGRSERADHEVLLVIATAPDPVVTSSEVAEELEMSQQGAFSRLQSFEERDLVRSRKVGARARVWWLEPPGRRLLDEKLGD